MSRDIVPVHGSDVESARAALQAPGPVTWRRVHLRFGWFELSYASIRRKPERLPPPSVPMAHLPPPQRSFRNRFLGVTGAVIASSLFLIGAASVWSIKSSAIIMRTVYNWPITQAGTKVAADIHHALMVKPSTQSAVLHASIAPAPKGVATSAPDPQSQPDSAMVMAPVAPAFDRAHLDRIPAVRDAINRALSTGQMQNWQAGSLEGVVVVGPETPGGREGATCRHGSILARDGGFSGQTQAFERCS